MGKTVSRVVSGIVSAGAAPIVGAVTPSAPKPPPLPELPTEANQQAALAAAEREERRRRTRRANIVTSPLGALVQEPVQVRTLLGQ